MKSTLLTLVTALAFSTGTPLFAQTPPSDQEQMAVLIKELQTQQAAMTANQAKIEEKLAAVAEELRVARIYASRGGR